MAHFDHTVNEDEYILLMDKDEAKALAEMISGSSIEERRIFFPVFDQIKKSGLI